MNVVELEYLRLTVVLLLIILIIFYFVCRCFPKKEKFSPYASILANSTYDSDASHDFPSSKIETAPSGNYQDDQPRDPNYMPQTTCLAKNSERINCDPWVNMIAPSYSIYNYDPPEHESFLKYI